MVLRSYYGYPTAGDPGYTEALDMASNLRGVVSYSAASQVLQKKGWEIDQKQFYNLLRKEDKGALTRQDEAFLP